MKRFALPCALLVALLMVAPVGAIAPAAAAEVAIIRIVQDTIPHHPHNFLFVGELGRFRLDDDLNSPTARVRMFEVDPANSPFNVRQMPNEARWPLVGLSCSDAESVIDFAHHAASIHAKAGEVISCVWVNHRV